MASPVRWPPVDDVPGPGGVDADRDDVVDGVVGGVLYRVAAEPAGPAQVPHRPLPCSLQSPPAPPGGLVRIAHVSPNDEAPLVGGADLGKDSPNTVQTLLGSCAMRKGGKRSVHIFAGILH